MSIGAVLLAAGAAERFGRRPKCLLLLDGVPLVRRVHQALAAAGIDEIVVVLGHHGDAVAAALAGSGAVIIRNPDPDQGQVSSQRIGLAAVTGAHDAVIIALADQPLIEADDIEDLIDAWQERNDGISVVVPFVDGRRGNPVILAADVRQQILSGAADFGGRQWQAAHPAQVAPFVTENGHYGVDIDSAEDLARFEADTGRALRWPPGL